MRYVLYMLLIVTIFLFGCAERHGKTDVSTQRNQTTAPPSPERVSLNKKKEQPGVGVDDREVVELQREKGKRSIKKIPAPSVAAEPQKPVEIHPGQRKKVFEFVQIGGEKYPVPRPWRGKRIAEKTPSFSELQQIPVEFTYNRGELFIRRDACKAFVNMARQAHKDGVDLRVHSGFRSIWYQKNIFTKLMAAGRTWEDLVRYVAPPGYSEHMLGMSVDLYPSNWEFASTNAYRWLQENAADFGFTETYPEYGTDGFPWEAWHWRYSPTAPDSERRSSPQTVAKYGKAKQQE